MDTTFAFRLTTKQRLQIGLCMRDALLQQYTWLSADMVNIINKWIINVIDNLCALDTTLFLSLSMFYRFLNHLPCSTEPVMIHYHRDRWHLIAITCIFICSKLHERLNSTPAPEYYVRYLTAQTFTKEDMFEMEEKVLRHIQYFIYPPGYMDLIFPEENVTLSKTLSV